MTITETLTAYANEALNYWRDEASSAEQPTYNSTMLEFHDTGYTALAFFLADDIRDLYKNGNLTEIFPSLEQTEVLIYASECTFLYDNCDWIAETASALIQNR